MQLREMHMGWIITVIQSYHEHCIQIQEKIAAEVEEPKVPMDITLPPFLL